MEDQKNVGEEVEMEDENQGSIKQWFQDNLRIIISVLIVVLIAGGIYSYSKRTAAPTLDEKTAEQTITSEENKEGVTTENKSQAKPQAPVAVSQETENSFIETAGKGDGTTHLARRALANYLEKNPDSALTAEHKIYIEDFLRKNIAKKGGVRVGTSVEFSKSLIQDAISRSKNLNERQLKNLHKYAVRVPSLS